MIEQMSEQQTIRTLSDRLVQAQAPIRILDAIKWGDEVKREFFANKCERLPAVDHDFYQKHPLPFDAKEKVQEFRAIIRDTRNQLGMYSTITRMIERRCEDYCKAVKMLVARGTPFFSQIAMELYGGPDDAFYSNGPRLSDLGALLGDVLKSLSVEIRSEADDKKYTAQQVVDILQARFSIYFDNRNQALVKISDNIVADASAGADSIRINQHVLFSERDIKYLEVHEGWVHLGTTINGASQPFCTFLAKGSPASSITQEGLAVVTEVFTFSSNPTRMLKLTNRVKAIDLVAQGANFIDIFRLFKSQGWDDDESYTYALRVFRGSTPDGKPFTKDLCYTKGFVLIYNYFRLAVKQGLVHQIPLFFVGKTLIDEVQGLQELIDQGIVNRPLYMPPQFKDLAALSAWMSFSLYLNKFDLETLAKHYRFMLHG